MDIIRIAPVFKETIWGGNKLKTVFGYDIPSEHTGECWAVSAHENGDCRIVGGEFDGMLLSQLWATHREVFGNMDQDVFPLLTKIIDANDDLSIQVHPDDEYAGKNENGSLGKTECWYILDCDEDASLVIGHNASTKQELTSMIQEKKWNELIREVPIKKGDFVQIIPGTVHAIKSGTMVLETQQSSDVTYRLYDYDRLSDGKLRPLHIKQSIDVINVPHIDAKQEKVYKKSANDWFEMLISCRYYNVWKAEISGKKILTQDQFFIIGTCLEGEAVIGDTKVQKGDNFIIPSTVEKLEVTGKASFIFSSANS